MTKLSKCDFIEGIYTDELTLLSYRGTYGS
jgi:hypothetical protein